MPMLYLIAGVGLVFGGMALAIRHVVFRNERRRLAMDPYHGNPIGIG
ncbi:MAG: hypothetical protein WBK28_00165 [Minisyncoccia bacterium]